MNIQDFLSNKIHHAMIKAGIPANYMPQVHQTNRIKFGNYQSNGIIATARKLGERPLYLAQKVVSHLNLNGIASKVEIANPGFINIFLEREWLAEQVFQILQLPRLGITNLAPPQTIVIDYSAPNVAKEMHIGHVRSTIIGDAVVCTLLFLGHNVIRANHIGDWGTQFGMLIAYLERQQNKNNDELILSDLETFYCEAKRTYDEDEQFAEYSRKYVVKLQNGDEYCRNMWRKIVDITMSQNQKIYERLNVSLTHKDIMGESFYNNMLPGIVADLRKKGLAVTSSGATVVFLNEFKDKNGKPIGVIIQKKDGGYLYTTTDIACAKYRYETLKADRIIYYVDSRQHQHLQQAWTIARKAGYVPKYVSLEHHSFGMILGKDGSPFKTRNGNTIKLISLLDEAVERALNLIRNKNPQMPRKELQELAEIVGIGAVKYSDLSKSRTTNYIFDWDKMLSFEGNTALYIQYAYTRILSILRKVSIDINTLSNKIMLMQEEELQLVIRLLQFEEAIVQVARDGTPHIMCSYLYDLTSLFSSFYENCPILFAKDKQIYHSRLHLLSLTAKTLKQGLNMLGIKTAERM